MVHRTIKEQNLGGFRTKAYNAVGWPNIWTWFAKDVGVKSVMDVGCAEGHSLRFFEGLGLKNLQERLKIQYKNNASFKLIELSNDTVEAKIIIPFISDENI